MGRVLDDRRAMTCAAMDTFSVVLIARAGDLGTPGGPDEPRGVADSLDSGRPCNKVHPPKNRCNSITKGIKLP